MSWHPMSHEIFLKIIVISTLIDVAAMATILFGTRWLGERYDSTEIGLRRIVVAVLVTSLVFIVKLTPLTLLGVNLFGVIHLVYVDLLVLPPVAALALLGASCVRSKERWRWVVTKPARIVAIGAFAVVPIGVYASWVEPFRLRLESARVPLIPVRQGDSTIRSV